jgi:intein-encoded DNA endonuclease-like protein
MKLTGKTKVLREKPAQCQFVHYESHKDYSTIKPGPWQLDAGLCSGMAYLNRFSNSLGSVCIDIVRDECCSGTVM